MRAPARVRFISCEPLLGALDLSGWLKGTVDWVIAGGESGPRSRPSDPAWFRGLRDQCIVAGVPFHFKQWGNWAPTADEKAGRVVGGTPMMRGTKVDLLGFGMLFCLRRAFGLLRRHAGLDLDLARVPRDCPATYEMLRRADSLGVFQVESRAQMTMLPRLRPECFYDLVVQVAIVRSGAMRGAGGKRGPRSLPRPSCR